MAESKTPCDRGLVKSVFRAGKSEVFMVDCVLPLGHVVPHVTAAGQKFSDGAQQ